MHSPALSDGSPPAVALMTVALMTETLMTETLMTEKV